MTGY
jgi:hypothetical protein